jgi:hypothetical protein
VQECVPFRKAIGKESAVGGDTGSGDRKDDSGGAGALGRANAYKPGVGQASVMATRLEKQRQAQREMEQAAE